MLWGDHEPHPLVVQFKGFEVSDLQLGRSQIRNCKESISKFRASNIKARTYLLVHNRTGKAASFRREIEAEQTSMVSSGQVERAELWDRQKLLKNTFDATLERVLRSSNLTSSMG
jgi:hypothetical protein